MLKAGAAGAPAPASTPAAAPTIQTETEIRRPTLEWEQGSTTTTAGAGAALADQAPPERCPSTSHLRRGFRPQGRPGPRYHRAAADVDRRHRGHGRALPPLLHTTRRHTRRAVRAARRRACSAARAYGPCA